MVSVDSKTNNIWMDLFDSQIRPEYTLQVRMDLVVIVIKDNAAHSKPLHLEPHKRIQFTVITWITASRKSSLSFAEKW